MNEPYWLTREECLALHELMVALHGGTLGLRDETLLESALAKPQNVFAYGNPTMADLAASYTMGIVKNHPFLDGNMRTGFMMGAGFLERNGFEFFATEADAAIRTLALAAGEMTESAYAAWLETNSKKVT
ncbi:MAG: type II toxin-antitoxin system death-on-curing family toxin [Prosthecobacter sp.]|jgi:death-on-curing protein|uniref:type II toxin-antitoxin system death-on-curing family toxin n=1 Tax=Prosthecobacter sp. TaxID=1965333 RepID=UPI001A101C3B|nr:type II toxin-antitoxin system death-on-curing family toxin [Prosthecobacter sp.]MBE2283634.1 type II toxin-antitoxin system death-on-curing family toxin [Prosthecobacter sp.]